MDMTPAEVATCICDIYERIGRLECRLENTQRDLGTAIEQNRQHTEGLLSQQTDVENKIDIALTTAVHELIEYLRYRIRNGYVFRASRTTAMNWEKSY